MFCRRAFLSGSGAAGKMRTAIPRKLDANMENFRNPGASAGIDGGYRVMFTGRWLKFLLDYTIPLAKNACGDQPNS
jgi:hypothetical protein